MNTISTFYYIQQKTVFNDTHHRFIGSNVQLLPIIFLDSDFCHNYLHTPVVLN